LNSSFPVASKRIGAKLLFQPPNGTPADVGRSRVGTRYALGDLEKGMSTMTKTLDVITEAIRSSKHPFTKTDNRPKKAHKHRYERRKIKEYLQLGDWLTEEAI
jgi:hypothetical protein